MMTLILWIGLCVCCYSLVMIVLSAVVSIVMFAGISIAMILNGEIRKVGAIICVAIIPILIQCASAAFYLFIIGAIGKALGFHF